MQEGIRWTPIDYFNNKIVCDLIENKVVSIWHKQMEKTEQDFSVKYLGNCFAVKRKMQILLLVWLSHTKPIYKSYIRYFIRSYERSKMYII